MVANLKDVPRHHYTLEEYFALERASEARFEYWDGEVLCMSGGTDRHYLISENLRTRLAELLRGRDCRPFSGAVPIHTPSFPPYRYPDVSVVCGQPLFVTHSGIDALTNPVLIVEVLSPGTDQLDKGAKRTAYQKVPSVREYLIVAQDAPHVTQYLRRGRQWVRKDFGDLHAMLELPSIKSQLRIGDIYEGIVFS
jgi:Uma2 family endonuclease